ncbi:VOC family protein [Sinisalibacter aestuarii]|uniref:VOC family protein n=1 Tax=Sinisalibacter aestuarii TaxID=2949426 RepID=A0ABQ5LQ56_9RHOB|nr:VOC family protein [Sinisalibacter aestuarii]GKY87132.1 VOC family protein [Sinisalibacter aestuarii]
MSKLRTCLWFDGAAEEAARFYVSLIPGSGVETLAGATAEGKPLMVNFHLAGVPYQALNGGPMFTHSPAVSIAVITEDQAETDRLWDALIADGGAESRCAWCVDRFGVSWQVVPRQLMATVGGADPAGAARATEAMFTMNKIDIATLEAAYRG